MTAPTDHMTIAEIIHDFATRQGDLTDRWAREDLAAILERRMFAEVSSAEIRGQMKHITAEMVRGDQPLEAKEELIADLRARLSQAEAVNEALREGVERLVAARSYWGIGYQLEALLAEHPATPTEEGT